MKSYNNKVEQLVEYIESNHNALSGDLYNRFYNIMIEYDTFYYLKQLGEPDDVLNRFNSLIELEDNIEEAFIKCFEKEWNKESALGLVALFKINTLVPVIHDQVS